MGGQQGRPSFSGQLYRGLNSTVDYAAVNYIVDNCIVDNYIVDNSTDDNYSEENYTPVDGHQQGRPSFIGQL